MTLNICGYGIHYDLIKAAVLMYQINEIMLFISSIKIGAYLFVKPQESGGCLNILLYIES